MCSAGARIAGVRRHTLRVEETKSECRQKVEHSCRERAHIARGTKNPVTPCPNPMCRHRLSCRPHQQTLFAFILPIARSAVCASPILRCPSPNCGRKKDRSSIPAVDSAQVRCGRYAESLVTARASSVVRSGDASMATAEPCPLLAAREADNPTFLGWRW